MSDRQLGLGMATALVVGNTIGMGIFMQPAALAPAAQAKVPDQRLDTGHGHTPHGMMMQIALTIAGSCS